MVTRTSSSFSSHANEVMPASRAVRQEARGERAERGLEVESGIDWPTVRMMCRLLQRGSQSMNMALVSLLRESRVCAEIKSSPKRFMTIQYLPLRCHHPLNQITLLHMLYLRRHGGRVLEDVELALDEQLLLNAEHAIRVGLAFATAEDRVHLLERLHKREESARALKAGDEGNSPCRESRGRGR